MGSSIADLQSLSKLLDESAKAQGKAPKPQSEIEPQKPKDTPSAAFVPQKRETDKKAIWTEEELKQADAPNDDGREIPKYNFIYSQRVGAEDVYLGIDPLKNPHTMCSNELVMEIQLPKEDSSKHFNLDIKKQKLLFTSSIYYLFIALPYPVFDKQGSAKWDQKKKELRVTLPIDPEGMFG